MTKSQIQFIRSLNQQKYRKEHKAYLVEGDKNAKEWLASQVAIQMVAAEQDWLSTNQSLLALHPHAEIIPAKDFELAKISSLKTPQEVVLVVQQAPIVATQAKSGWVLLLEKIQNPGNMGTIIRIADWFGIDKIYCTEDCVEVYNPKVIQATMGSLLRVPIQEVKLQSFLQANKEKIYAASLGGQSLYKLTDATTGIIAMGNESVGLSSELLAAAHQQIKIPGKGQAESLNVAVATGIICAFLTR